MKNEKFMEQKASEMSVKELLDALRLKLKDEKQKKLTSSTTVRELIRTLIESGSLDDEVIPKDKEGKELQGIELWRRKSMVVLFG